MIYSVHISAPVYVDPMYKALVGRTSDESDDTLKGGDSSPCIVATKLQ